MRESLVSRLVREEQGFTLTEVVVTMMIMITVMFALYSIFDMSIRVFSFGNDKVEATENARLGLEKMEREVRAAYPADKINGLEHVFFERANPTVATLPAQRSITFGNDLAQGVSPPNRRIVNSNTAAVDPREVVTYELRHRDGTLCPSVGTDGVCRLQRIVTSDDGATLVSSPVADNIVPNGLTFTYFRGRPDAGNPGNLEPATAADGTDIGVVRIRLDVNVDGRTQTLTTDVDLRNRGG
jgi:hypothetical protein